MVGSLLTLSCKKEVEAPKFDITFDQKVYTVDEPITFGITGGAELITFYSGESGNEYEFRERFRVDGTPTLQFNTYRQNAPQDNSLSLMVSTDFSGTYDVENLQKATWTDITSRAMLSEGIDNTPSGSIDLSDLQQEGIPLYIAFKYIGKEGRNSQPIWAVKNMEIDNNLADGSVASIAKSSNISWGAISVAGDKIWSYNTTQARMVGSVAYGVDNEDWLITEPLQLDRVQRSFGVNIKPNPTSSVKSYEFSGFSKAGIYTVTFEAINSDIDDIKRSLKEFTITVQ